MFPEYAALFDFPTPEDCTCTDRAPAFNVHNDIKSLQASVVGSLWIGKKFSVFGRAGGMYWKAETVIGVGDPDGPPKVTEAANDTGFAPLLGVGIQTTLDGALLRLEYQYSDLGDLTDSFNFSQTDNEYSALSLSIVWML